MKRFLLPFFGLIAAASFYVPHVSAQTATPVQGNMSVSAIVPPNGANFQFSFASNSSGRIPQNHNIVYEITYGVYESNGINVDTTITVNFDDDKTSEGTHVTDYISGSATRGYGDAQPIVNLENRTITWNIQDLPGGTVDQKIYFHLRTNTNYVGERSVYIDTYADLSNDYTTLSTKKTTHEYLYDPKLVTPGPTQPAAIPTMTVTPTPTSTVPRITSVSFPTISDNRAQVEITANKPVKRLIRYGTDPINLNQTAQNTQFKTTDLVELNNLKPETKYYFRVTVTDLNGRSVTSDTFTFQTAKLSPFPLLTGNSIVISSGGNIILSDILNGTNIPFSILLTQSDYTLNYTLNNFRALKGADVVIRDSSGSIMNEIHMLQNEPRVYTSALHSGDAATQTIYVRLTDQNGNVAEQKVAVIKVMPRLQVLELDSHLPIADARIVISKYNLQTNRFEPLSPMYTNANGQLELLLPQGRYRAEASAFGFAESVTEFKLGSNPQDNFPTIFLKKDLFNIPALFNYLYHYVMDSLAWLIYGLNILLSSPRWFTSVAFLTLGCFGLLSILFFTYRTDIRWRDLVPFFIFHTIVLRNKHKGLYLYGVILDTVGKPVSRARIEIIDIKTNTVFTHVMSNKNGSFSVRNTFKQQYVKFQITKEGYAAAESLVATDSNDLVKIHLDEHSKQSKAITRGLRHIFGELFELALLLTLLAELLFIIHFGVAKMLPFFLLSIFNLFLWVFFQREKKIY